MIYRFLVNKDSSITGRPIVETLNTVLGLTQSVQQVGRFKLKTNGTNGKKSHTGHEYFRQNRTYPWALPLVRRPVSQFTDTAVPARSPALSRSVGSPQWRRSVTRFTYGNRHTSPRRTALRRRVVSTILIAMIYIEVNTLYWNSPLRNICRCKIVHPLESDLECRTWCY